MKYGIHFVFYIIRFPILNTNNTPEKKIRLERYGRALPYIHIQSRYGINLSSNYYLYRDHHHQKRNKIILMKKVLKFKFKAT